MKTLAILRKDLRDSGLGAPTDNGYISDGFLRHYSFDVNERFWICLDGEQWAEAHSIDFDFFEPHRITLDDIGVEDSFISSEGEWVTIEKKEDGLYRGSDGYWYKDNGCAMGLGRILVAITKNTTQL